MNQGQMFYTLPVPLIDELQKEVHQIKARNTRVEADKAWEVSWTRKIVIAVFTYVVVVTFFFVADLPKPFVNALVPSGAFILSTFSLGFIKRLWLTRR